MNLELGMCTYFSATGRTLLSSAFALWAIYSESSKQKQNYCDSFLFNVSFLHEIQYGGQLELPAVLLFRHWPGPGCSASVRLMPYVSSDCILQFFPSSPSPHSSKFFPPTPNTLYGYMLKFCSAFHFTYALPFIFHMNIYSEMVGKMVSGMCHSH